MKLTHVRGNPDAAPFLYELLAERPPENFISHETMPTRDAHEEFVAGHPFRYWYLIDEDGAYVGAIEVTDRNEIGVTILARHQHRKLGSLALRLFLDTHKPLPALPALRNGRWLANVSPKNEASFAFFEHQGFETIQITMALK